ncbi:MAG: hypothetical protein PHW53_02735 [Patescibacteria group bacterium]|nr:hypothetical protein [Patescibacteria group bacterium]
MISLSYGFIAGGIGGIVMAILIHLAPLIASKKYLPDIDKYFFLGRHFSAREVHLFGIFIQLALSVIFGGIYILLVDQKIIFHDFHYVSILFYGVLVWLAKGAILTPLLGAGFFGAKQGKYVWLEMFIIHQIYALVFWLAVNLYV